MSNNEIVNVGSPDELWKQAVEMSQQMKEEIMKKGNIPAVQVLGAAVNLAFDMFGQTREGTEFDKVVGAEFLKQFAMNLSNQFGFFVVQLEQEPDHRKEYLG